MDLYDAAIDLSCVQICNSWMNYCIVRMRIAV